MELGLAETIQALHEELEEAVARSNGREIQFLVGPIQVELHVSVKREAGAGGKARFWVIEAGTDGKYARESIQKVSVTLEPVGANGSPLRVQRSSAERP